MSSSKPSLKPALQQTQSQKHKPYNNQLSHPKNQNPTSSHKHAKSGRLDDFEHIDEEEFDDDMELFDLLCVALHFAGVKKSCQQQILQAYAKELDCFDDDMPYGQEQMIAIIKSLRKKFPESFT